MARPPSDIQGRVVRAARARFLTEGVDGASLRGIARDARTSIGMVYYYFPTKDDLFLAVVESVYLGLLHDLERALAPATPVVARVEALYRRLGEATPLEQDVLRLVLREALASPRRLSRLLERFRRGHIPLLLGLVQDGLRAGVFRDDLPPPLVLMAMMAIGGPGQVMLQALQRRLPLPALPPPAARARLLVQMLLGGVGAAPPGRVTRPRRSRPGTSATRRR